MKQKERESKKCFDDYYIASQQVIKRTTAVKNS